jgi:hypothetical protein
MTAYLEARLFENRVFVGKGMRKFQINHLTGLVLCERIGNPFVDQLEH